MSNPSRPPVPVLIDLDGTVWDSRAGIIECLAAALRDAGLAVPEDGELAACIGPPLERTLARLGVAEESLDRAVATFRAHYRETGEASVTLYDGAMVMLDDLAELGHPLVTATSKAVDPVRRLLDRLDLAHRFDAVAAAPMSGIGAEKIDIISAALALAGDEATGPAVMVGDRASDIAAAHHHGLESIAVRWGYAAAGELEAAGPHLWADRPSDVVEHLRARRTGFATDSIDR